MTHREQMVAFIVALLMLAGGFTWLFGPFGLIGVGAVLLLLALFVQEPKEGIGNG